MTPIAAYLTAAAIWAFAEGANAARVDDDIQINPYHFIAAMLWPMSLAILAGAISWLTVEKLRKPRNARAALRSRNDG